MKTKGVLTAILIFMFASIANAGLHDRGGGLIYDDVLGITWLQNANLKGSTMTWSEANDWAANLVFQGYDDWRLPSTDSSCSGYNCSAGEIGHLFYSNGVTSDSDGLFTDISPYMYWTATSDVSDITRALRFNFQSGYQGASSKTYARYAWAVREGDSAPPVAPEPLSTLLFVTGGATISAGKYLKKRIATSL